jgi:hypothetical protein
MVAAAGSSRLGRPKLILRRSTGLKTKLDADILRYAQMAAAKLTAGNQDPIDPMQRELDDKRALLEDLRQAKARARGPWKAKPAVVAQANGARLTAGRSGWSDDPAERSREMKRRQAVAKANREATKRPSQGAQTASGKDDGGTHCGGGDAARG